MSVVVFYSPWTTTDWVIKAATQANTVTTALAHTHVVLNANIWPHVAVKKYKIMGSWDTRLDFFYFLFYDNLATVWDTAATLG